MIRDVAASYRRAISETVHHYSGWRPTPALIDSLKGEGCWNNDWEASHELLRRWRRDLPTSTHAPPMPPFEALVEMFSSFYFGGDPNGDSQHWHGFIRSEPLLVAPSFFDQLGADGIAWGFVSGAEPPSARYVLEQRLGLVDPPLIAMGEAPDKPDPSGFLQLAGQILAGWPGRGLALGPGAPPVAYLGDTVADVQTVQRARRACPDQRFLSLAVAPPHLQVADQQVNRRRYESALLGAGADRILPQTDAVLAVLGTLL